MTVSTPSACSLWVGRSPSGAGPAVASSVATGSRLRLLQRHAKGALVVVPDCMTGPDRDVVREDIPYECRPVSRSVALLEQQAAALRATQRQQPQLAIPDQRHRGAGREPLARELGVD